MHKLLFPIVAFVSLALVGLQAEPIAVPYTDIGTKVQILGRFGKPLGTPLVLDGVRFGNSTGPTMMGGGNFRVESVNGFRLSQRVELWIPELRNTAAGTRCKVQGYETGGMIGKPGGNGISLPGETQQQAAWQFQVEFVPTKVKA